MKKLIVTLLVLAGALAVADEAWSRGSVLMRGGKITIDLDELAVTPRRMMTTPEYFAHLCDMYNLSENDKDMVLVMLRTMGAGIKKGEMSLQDVLTWAEAPKVNQLPYDTRGQIIGWIAAQCAVHTLICGWVDDALEKFVNKEQ